jgi:hypothetical protein
VRGISRSGTPEQLLEANGLSAAALVRTIRTHVSAR